MIESQGESNPSMEVDKVLSMLRQCLRSFFYSNLTQFEVISTLSGYEWDKQSAGQILDWKLEVCDTSKRLEQFEEADSTSHADC
jgi:hypothetical protein